jgi:basic amino acid/polyamine antiporter, APA family
MTVMLTFLLGGHPRPVLDEPRRALPPWFAKVDSHGTSQRVTWIAGVGAAFLAASSRSVSSRI